MKVTPLDLRQQNFRTTMRGFDRTEVTAFLAEVADEYEQAVRETDRLRGELARMEVLLTEHRERERDLRNTLITAQRLADDIKANAEQDARRIVRDAEGRAELVVEKAQSRASDIQREIEALKMKRRDVEGSLESTIAAVRNALEFVREQRDRDEKAGADASGTPWRQAVSGAPADASRSEAHGGNSPHDSTGSALPAGTEPAAADLGVAK